MKQFENEQEVDSSPLLIEYADDVMKFYNRAKEKLQILEKKTAEYLQQQNLTRYQRMI